MAGSYARERTALIVTVLNEAAGIDALLESVASQTRLPDEVVVVDGGSHDGTWKRLESWSMRLPLRPLRYEGVNIARGRNLAIAATTAEIVAATDAGVRLEPDWLANLLARLGPEVDVVSGFFVPDAQTAFERVMAATVLPNREDVRAETFLPSSRSVLFRRKVWESIGGYPEWLDYCEDLVFDLALRRHGARFAFASDATVHFKPRGTLGAFFRQYFLYARGDGKADLWRRRHAIRYATYAAIPFLLRRGPIGWVLLFAGALAYCRRPYQRLMAHDLNPFEMASAVMLVPVIRLVGDLAKMLGYPV
ncbi:MAG: glycosyltransferase, partial [Chloroflexi bacterium]|nr:glycosyltransferase [Chloroflexota bacterium]